MLVPPAKPTAILATSLMVDKSGDYDGMTIHGRRMTNIPLDNVQNILKKG